MVSAAMATSFCGNSVAGCVLYPWWVSQLVMTTVRNLCIGIVIYVRQTSRARILVSSEQTPVRIKTDL